MKNSSNQIVNLALERYQLQDAYRSLKKKKKNYY